MDWKYPPARKDAITDNYHGTPVNDPYRWMEDPTSPDTQAWIAAQNALTRQYLDRSADCEAIQERLTALWNSPKYTIAFRQGDYYVFDLNDGLQNQAVMYIQRGLDGTPHVVLDPNQLSEDGTVALTGHHFAKDGMLMVYGTSSSGSDQQVNHIRDLESGHDYLETLQHCRWTNVAWKQDKSGFYYDRYPAPDSGEDPYYHSRVYWHTLGTPQEQDILIYEQLDAPELGFAPILTHDEQYLVLHVWHGAINRNRIYYRKLKGDEPFIRLLNEADAEYTFLGSEGTVFYFLTDKDAPRSRIVAIDVENPTQWREIVPEGADALQFAVYANGHFLACYLHDAHSKVLVYNREGAFVRELPLPGMGNVFALLGESDQTEVFIPFTSFLTPMTIFRYDFTTNALTVFKESPLPMPVDGYETTQVFCTSKDGTRVPMFLIHKKGLALNGNNPVLLYGYGGYSNSMTPAYAPWTLYWVEMGGVFAQACLRGGAEYGEEWHQAGMLDRKQNVFDDFIAAGEWLIAQGYTRQEKLAIMGGSNGGLLVAACMLQRPELFGAVICKVPVTDMLRFHKFTAGRFWTPEYGDPDNPAHFPFLYTYSPLHNVKAGVSYPPILVLTADTDDRVVPMHSLKFAAALQTAANTEDGTGGNSNPILLRVDVKAGHGFGKPTTKLIEEWTDIFAFLSICSKIGCGSRCINIHPPSNHDGVRA